VCGGWSRGAGDGWKEEGDWKEGGDWKEFPPAKGLRRLNVYWREGLNCREEYLRSKDPLAGSRTDSLKLRSLAFLVSS